MLAAGPMGTIELPAWRTSALAVWMAVWWVTEAVPIPATALLPLVLLPLLGILSMNAAAAAYANPVIYLFLGGFLIAAAFEQSGLHRRLALALVQRAGARPEGIIAGFMLSAGFMSMWVSNTATVLMLLPLATSLIDRMHALRGDDPSIRRFEPALLLGLAYAATLGGLGTLIGTPPNALLAGYLASTHDIRIPFGTFMLIAVPIVIVSLPITWLLLTRVLFPLRGVELPLGREMIAAERAALGPMSRGEIAVAVVAILTAAAWVTQPLLVRIAPGITDANISIAGALLLLVVPLDRDGRRVIDWRAAERIPWGVLVLFGGGLSLAAAIQESGLAAWIGNSVGALRDVHPLLLIAVVTTLVLFLTELTSNTATAAAFLPVVGSVAVGAGMSPLLLTVPAALAATCAFMLPVGTPPNAIVFGTGRLTIPQMARAGVLLNVMMVVIISITCWLLVEPVLGRGPSAPRGSRADSASSTPP